MMDIEARYPLSTAVKIEQTNEIGIGTGKYKTSVNYGIITGYANQRSICVELTSGDLVDSPTYNHSHVWHPVDHEQCTTTVIEH